MKHVLTIAIMFLPLLLSAQIEKGDWLLTGGLTFSNTSEKPVTTNGNETTTSSFGLSPIVGYAISSKFVVGLSSGISFASSKNNNQKSTNNRFRIGPMVRLYHPLTEKFFFIGQGTISVISDKSTSPTYDSNQTLETTLKGLEVSVAPGFAYFVTDRLSIELMIGYLSLTTGTREQSLGTPGTSISTLRFEGGFVTRGLSPGLTFRF